MTRWYVGVKADGARQVIADKTGTDPTAAARGNAEISGPYHSESDAAKAARAKPFVPRRSRRPT
jgi:hypothetical protein